MIPNRPAATARFDPERLFRPRSLAIMGGDGRLADQVRANIAAAGFAGPIQVVPRRRSSCARRPCHPHPANRRHRTDLRRPRQGRHPCGGRVGHGHRASRGPGGYRRTYPRAWLLRHRLPGDQAERHPVPSHAQARPRRADLAVCGAVPCGAGLGGAERGGVQPDRRDWRQCGHRVRAGPGLPFPRLRHRPHPARHPPHPGPARLPLCGPRRRPAAPRGRPARRQPPAGFRQAGRRGCSTPP